MNSKDVVPYLLVTLLLWIPAVLVLYPPQPAGEYVFFGFQFTRPLALVGFFTILLVGFVAFTSYSVWQYHTAAPVETSVSEESRE